MAEPSRPAAAPGRTLRRAPPRRPVPQSFQTRLTLAFTGVVALTLVLVAPVVVWRLDDYFRQQEEQRLQTRADATAAAARRARSPTRSRDDRPVVRVDSTSGTLTLNPTRRRRCSTDGGLPRAHREPVAQADVEVEFGPARRRHGRRLRPSTPNPAPLVRRPAPTSRPSRARPRIRRSAPRSRRPGGRPTRADWGLEVRLSNPYTCRATTLADDHRPAARHGRGRVRRRRARSRSSSPGRFTTPLRRLTEASRAPRRGRPRRRGSPTDDVSPSTLELRALSRQFNAMADRLEESVGIIRRDRDRSRDFLADVSHELRTPIAAHAHVQRAAPGAGRPTTRRRARSSSTPRRPAARAARLAGPEPARALEARLRASCCSTSGRTTSAARRVRASSSSSATAERAGIALDRRPARAPAPDPPRPAAHRPGRVATSSATRSSSRPGRRRCAVDARAEPDGGARIEVADTGRRHRAAPSCRSSSSASTAAREPNEAREQRLAASASRSSSRSWTCTTGRSRSRAASGPGRRFVVDAARATRARSPRSTPPQPDPPAPSPPASRRRSRWRPRARRT